MLQLNPILLRRSKVCIVGEIVDNGVINAGDQVPIQCDPEQERDHTLADRAHIVWHLGRMGDLAQVAPPPLVSAGEVGLIEELASARDEDGVMPPSLQASIENCSQAPQT